jgi:hypothetical protein
MQQPPGPAGPQLSPDGKYWWDGVRWVPLGPPQAYWQQPPSYQVPAPSPGLMTFLIVMLGLGDAVTGLFALFGLLAGLDYLGLFGNQDSADTGAVVLIFVFFGLFAIMVAATVGVVGRRGWGRWVAIAAGVAMCLTCLGSVVGIPIIVAAIRAPMMKKPVPLGYA